MADRIASPVAEAAAGASSRRAAFAGAKSDCERQNSDLEPQKNLLRSDDSCCISIY